MFARGRLEGMHVDLGLRDSVALVTGASRGIGAAIARAYGNVGCAVAVHYVSRPESAGAVVGEIEARGGRGKTFHADLTSYDECARLVEDVIEVFGRIDVLVNNAGDMVQRELLINYDLEDFDQVMRLNVASVFQMSRLVARGMIEAGSGSIINVSSAAVRSGGSPGGVPYATSKGAVSAMTRGLAKELAPHGVRVNTLAPGPIETDFHVRHGGQQPLAGVAERIPLGRVGLPEDCVGAALFLASPV